MVKQVLSLLVTAFQSGSQWFTQLVNSVEAAPIIVSVLAFMIFFRMIIAPMLGGSFSGILPLSRLNRRSHSSSQRKDK